MRIPNSKKDTTTTTAIRGLKFKNGKFVIDKVVDGVRIYKTLDTRNAALARRILERLVDQTLFERYFPKRAGGITVRDALDRFWKEYSAHKTYAKSVWYNLVAVKKRLGGRKLSTLSRADIERYKRERFGDATRRDPAGIRTISPRTVQKELQYLSMAINFAVDNGRVAANPIKRFINVPQRRPKKIVLDDGCENGPQWAALYDALNVRAKPVALTLYETGMRPKECFDMRWDWLTEKAPGRWLITVPESADKTGSEHDIPVSAQLLALFRSMGLGKHCGDALIFPPRPNERRQRVNMDNAFRNALAQCGLGGRGITPYALRRTRITIWDAIDESAARYAAGHAVREIHVKHYVKISPKRLFQLVGLDYKVTRISRGESAIFQSQNRENAIKTDNFRLENCDI